VPTQRPIQWVPGVKWLGREGDYSPPSGSKVKNAWSYTCTPPTRLHGVVNHSATDRRCPCFVIKMFHPPSDTPATHKGISIHTTKSRTDESCLVSLFHKEFNDSTLTKQQTNGNHFLAAHDGNFRGAHVLMLRSCWSGKIPLIVL